MKPKLGRKNKIRKSMTRRNAKWRPDSFISQLFLHVLYEGRRSLKGPQVLRLPFLDGSFTCKNLLVLNRTGKKVITPLSRVPCSIYHERSHHVNYIFFFQHCQNLIILSFSWSRKVGVFTRRIACSMRSSWQEYVSHVHNCVSRGKKKHMRYFFKVMQRISSTAFKESRK